jgi:hypothetical protein
VTENNIEQRIKDPALRRAYLAWRNILVNRPTLPNIGDFEALTAECRDARFLTKFEDGTFRYLKVGEALTKRLGRSLDGELVERRAPELVGSLGATYRNCVTRQAPCYEYARFDMGDGVPMNFERLALPFFSAARTVSHVGGVALFADVAASTA